VAGWDDWRLAWTTDGAGPPEDNPWHSSSSLALSPDGGLVAVAGRRHRGTGSLALRDAASGALLREEAALTTYAPRPLLRFSTDGRHLTQMEEDRLHLWEVDGLKHLATASAPARAHFRQVALHPSGRFLATAGGDGAVRLWDALSLREARSYKWGVGK